MADQEHQVGSHYYKVGRLNARLQLHVVRRIAPVFADSAPLVISIFHRLRAGEKIPVDAAVSQFGTVAAALKAMSDEDVDYVTTVALSAVQRRLDGGAGWAPVASATGHLLYQDLQWTEILHLTWLVIKENVLNFFSDSPSGSTDGAQA